MRPARWSAWALAALALLPAPARAAEQTAVTVLFSSSLEAYESAWKGFRSRLDEEDRAFRTARRYLDKEEAPELINGPGEGKPDLVLALGTKAARETKARYPGTPMVFSMVLDPAPFAGPNAAGATLRLPPALILEEIRRILPGAKRVGLIYSEASRDEFEEISRACTKSGPQLLAEKIEDARELPPALKKIGRTADALLMVPDSKVYFPSSVEFLLRESLRLRLPVVGLSSFYTKAGALLAVECDYEDVGRQAGDLAVRILSGESPGALPPTRPRGTRISFNDAAARLLGIRIPASVRKRAAEVYGR